MIKQCTECGGTKDVLSGAGFCSECFERALHQAWDERQKARDAAQAAQHAVCLELVGMRKSMFDHHGYLILNGRLGTVLGEIMEATVKVTEATK